MSPPIEEPGTTEFSGDPRPTTDPVDEQSTKTIEEQSQHGGNSLVGTPMSQTSDVVDTNNQSSPTHNNGLSSTSINQSSPSISDSGKTPTNITNGTNGLTTEQTSSTTTASSGSENVLEKSKSTGTPGGPASPGSVVDEKSNTKDSTCALVDQEQKLISCQGCGKRTGQSMCCPVCASFGRNSFFCTQECFARNWPNHQKLHVLLKQQKELSMSLQTGGSSSSSARLNNGSPTSSVGTAELGVVKRAGGGISSLRDRMFNPSHEMEEDLEMGNLGPATTGSVGARASSIWNGVVGAVMNGSNNNTGTTTVDEDGEDNSKNRGRSSFSAWGAKAAGFLAKTGLAGNESSFSNNSEMKNGSKDIQMSPVSSQLYGRTKAGSKRSGSPNTGTTTTNINSDNLQFYYSWLRYLCTGNRKYITIIVVIMFLFWIRIQFQLLFGKSSSSIVAGLDSSNAVTTTNDFANMPGASFGGGKSEEHEDDEHIETRQRGESSLSMRYKTSGNPDDDMSFGRDMTKKNKSTTDENSNGGNGGEQQVSKTTPGTIAWRLKKAEEQIHYLNRAVADLRAQLSMPTSAPIMVPDSSGIDGEDNGAVVIGSRIVNTGSATTNSMKTSDVETKDATSSIASTSSNNFVASSVPSSSGIVVSTSVGTSNTNVAASTSNQAQTSEKSSSSSSQNVPTISNNNGGFTSGNASTSNANATPPSKSSTSQESSSTAKKEPTGNIVEGPKAIDKNTPSVSKIAGDSSSSLSGSGSFVPQSRVVQLEDNKSETSSGTSSPSTSFTGSGGGGSGSTGGVVAGSAAPSFGGSVANTAFASNSATSFSGSDKQDPQKPSFGSETNPLPQDGAPSSSSSFAFR